MQTRSTAVRHFYRPNTRPVERYKRELTLCGRAARQAAVRIYPFSDRTAHGTAIGAVLDSARLPASSRHLIAMPWLTACTTVGSDAQMTCRAATEDRQTDQSRPASEIAAPLAGEPLFMRGATTRRQRYRLLPLSMIVTQQVYFLVFPISSPFCQPSRLRNLHGCGPCRSPLNPTNGMRISPPPVFIGARGRT